MKLFFLLCLFMFASILKALCLQPGVEAPSFKAKSTLGNDISLKDYLGKVVVLYFYPKDDTPGCTKQACGLRDINHELVDLGAVVLGVSRDSIKSHEKFTAKYSLNFPLISDPDGSIHNEYGAVKAMPVPGPLKVKRSTFIIDKKGIVRHCWYGVKVDDHADRVLETVRELMAE